MAHSDKGGRTGRRSADEIDHRSAGERAKLMLLRPNTTRQPLARAIARVALGLGLAIAGVGHLTAQREEFQAQVPDWVPLDKDFVVLASGVVEILLGLALIALPRYRKLVSWVVAAFFVAVFPGNVHQYVEHIDAFGLDTDTERLVRLFFQPVLVVWALFAGTDGNRGSRPTGTHPDSA